MACKRFLLIHSVFIFKSLHFRSGATGPLYPNSIDIPTFIYMLEYYTSTVCCLKQKIKCTSGLY